jgi:hypothetical protein
MWPRIVTNFFLIKSTRRRNFPNFILSKNSTCFGHFLCPSSGVFYCTFDIGIFLAGLMTGSGWKILTLLRSCHQIFQSSDDSLIFDTQLINWFADTLSTTIGMDLWFAPQISEHCPYRRPGRLIENLTWFSRPGVASVFTPSLGTVHEF